jgi:hypothetical protein
MKLPLSHIFIVLCVLSTSSHAQLIGVKFIDTDDTPFGANTAGAPGYEQSNWNFVSTDWSGEAANDALFTAGLLDSSGAVASQFLAINYNTTHNDPVHYDSANTWRSGAGNATANDTLMNGYLDDGGDDQPYVNFSLDNGVLENYTVVVYIHGDVANGAVGRYWIEEWTDPLTAGTVITDQVGISSNDYTGTFEQAGSNFSQIVSPNPPLNVDVASGNFIVFDNLTARNFRVRSSGNGDPEDFGRGPLNAIQILPTIGNPLGDDDGDELLNGWEVTYGLNPFPPDGALGDDGKEGNPDGDGLNNFEEQDRKTNPNLTDTDADGLDDEIENGSGTWMGLANTGTNPLIADTDMDGLLDGVENNNGSYSNAMQTGTDPHNQFSDADGLPDGWEVTYDFNPTDATGVNGDTGDPDNDSSENLEEYTRTTDPRDDDTDDDTIFDGHEDGGGVWFSDTMTGTDPLDADSDDDTIPDGVETRTLMFVDVNDTGTDPNVHDTDMDGYFDEQELAAGTDPTKPGDKPNFPIPIGYWPFDDQGAASTMDVSPNANHATVNGAATYVAGHSGLPGDFAINLDGVDDSATTTLSLSNIGAFTMAGWVQFETAQVNRSGLFGQNDILEFGIIDTDIIHLWSNPGGAVNGTLTPAAEWRHIAFVGDTVSRRVYVDGVEISTGVAATPLGASAFFFNIGGGGIFDDVGNFFTGKMDDVAVWDRTLSQQLIQGLANRTISPIDRQARDLAISFISYSENDNEITITTNNTVPLASYEIAISLNLADWVNIQDFQGADGVSKTTVIFDAPFPKEPKVFYRVILIP